MRNFLRRLDGVLAFFILTLLDRPSSSNSGLYVSPRCSSALLLWSNLRDHHVFSTLLSEWNPYSSRRYSRQFLVSCHCHCVIWPLRPYFANCPLLMPWVFWQDRLQQSPQEHNFPAVPSYPTTTTRSTIHRIQRIQRVGIIFIFSFSSHCCRVGNRLPLVGYTTATVSF